MHTTITPPWPPAATPEPDPVDRACEEALAFAESHGLRAADVLARRLLNDPELLRAFHGRGLLVSACERCLQLHLQDSRHDAVAQMERPSARPGPPAPIKGTSGESFNYGDSLTTSSGLDFRLPIAGRPKIRDATAAQLGQAADHYFHSAHIYARKGCWMRELAEARKRGPLSEEFVAEAWQRVTSVA